MSLSPHHHPNRSYPPPRSPWAMAMSWHQLLFMHWPVPADLLRPHIPPSLSIDTYTGGPFSDQPFIGVVPFRMAGTRARLTPPIPGVSGFPELNVRTYVRDDSGRPGVWFFSLDAASRPAVETARALFHLPYYHAAMRCDAEPSSSTHGPWTRYRSERTDRRAPGAAFRARYQPTGPVSTAAPGSLESFLTDRYCLYAADRRGRTFRAEIHHAPWPLRTAEADVEVNTMTLPLGIDPAALQDDPGRWPLLHYAHALPVRAWLPRRIA